VRPTVLPTGVQLLSRRYYREFAQILSDARQMEPEVVSTPDYFINEIVLRFCDFFEEDNPNFDTVKFLEASGCNVD
jgi:hypothetical protein